MITLKLFGSLGLACVLWPALLTAKPVPAIGGIVSFGDSLSDTGNNPPPAGLDYFQGRWCNGPLWNEYLAKDMGVTLQNVAFAGSQTSGLSNQISAVATLGIDLSTNLCTIWSGANDFIQNTNDGLDDAAWTVVVNKGVANISNAVAALQQMGAHDFVVLNLPDLSKTPAGLESPAVFQTFIRGKIAQFNSGLADALYSLRQANSDVHLVAVEAFGLLDTVIADPAAYGFTNVTRDALDVFNNPAFDGPATNYLFWDEIHPTTKAHELICQWATNSIAAPPPLILVQPASQTVAIGTNTIFLVEASDADFYQWRFDGHEIKGATNATYVLNGVRAANAGSYSVIVSNAYAAVISSNALLTTYVPVSITVQPKPSTVVEGANASIAVRAAGTLPLYYQWQFNGTDLAGATRSALALSRVKPSQAGEYQVLVNNAKSHIPSAPALLTVIIPPAITTQPSGATVMAGQNTNFTVAATGTPPLAYQWRFNGRALAGATFATLSLTNVQPARAGDYSVKISNPAGSATSSNAVLIVDSIARTR
jgi:phospholipase/lecithinase/hemolysin